MFIGSIDPNLFASDLNYFFFNYFVGMYIILINNPTPSVEMNQLGVKKNPSNWKSLILLLEKGDRFFCSSSMQELNKSPPKSKMSLPALECAFMICWFKSPRKGSCGTLMQAAFFVTLLLKSTLESRPWLCTQALQSKQLLLLHLVS